LLRELRMLLAAQLQPVQQRGSHENVRRPVAGARPQEAAGAQRRDPEKARSRRRAADTGLEARLLHGLAAREEPDPAPVDLQLRPDAGSVERQVDPRAVASA